MIQFVPTTPNRIMLFSPFAVGYVYYTVFSFAGERQKAGNTGVYVYHQ
ncbi:hypothetical protein B4123_1064 [Bacillus paralicheniformis]|uniref:Uncharacterized protein n=1 Tax=Bacillus paralicheniformis TaxID=1648923 RepID=A0A6I7U7Z1_9BACI|nr:hypothetical protein SC10_B2orf05055 [Bacillus paralicheniformis]OLF94613.1 hypothetical protein B4121_1826 [Bacillus paralicheniformis]OLG00250.1 hypothetical protein B4123_4542 [Bacillus paralicheniformis]OLG09213.1 hypothetical protein B4125_0061 [Bacillus paralicheniformis]OLG12550.1 hypothetical protein B4123_1064 [Bacillus paralicheniformis]